MNFVYVFDENQDGVYKHFIITLDEDNKNVTSVTKLGLARKDDDVLVDQVRKTFIGKKIIWITGDKKHKKTFSSKGDTVIYYTSNNSTTKEKFALLNEALNITKQINNTGLLEVYSDYSYIRLGKEHIGFIKSDNSQIIIKDLGKTDINRI